MTEMVHCSRDKPQIPHTQCATCSGIVWTSVVRVLNHIYVSLFPIAHYITMWCMCRTQQPCIYNVPRMVCGWIEKPQSVNVYTTVISENSLRSTEQSAGNTAALPGWVARTRVNSAVIDLLCLSPYFSLLKVNLQTKWYNSAAIDLVCYKHLTLVIFTYKTMQLA